jgi:hypothetical protein
LGEKCCQREVDPHQISFLIAIVIQILKLTKSNHVLRKHIVEKDVVGLVGRDIFVSNIFIAILNPLVVVMIWVVVNQDVSKCKWTNAQQDQQQIVLNVMEGFLHDRNVEGGLLVQGHPVEDLECHQQNSNWRQWNYQPRFFKVAFCHTPEKNDEVDSVRAELKDIPKVLNILCKSLLSQLLVLSVETDKSKKYQANIN